jgi:sulfate-transporting ATPase
MSAQYIFTMHRVNKYHGQDKHVLQDISLSFIPGAKIGVLGPNGAGKSTLLKIMAGIEETSSGDAKLAPGASVGYLSQEPDLDESKDVRGNVEDGLGELRDLLKRFEELSMKFAEPLSDQEMADLLEEQGRVQEQIDKADAWDIDRRLDVAMDALRLPPGDADVTKLSGGERRRVALCRLLLSSPDLLLLDEPTNHLDAESVAWLEHHLQGYEGTVIAVTHDRYFLDNVAGWILELDRGEGIPFKGNYSSWLEQKQDRLDREQRAESDRQRTLQRELEWVKMTPAARQTKNKARIRAYEELLNQDRVEQDKELEIYIPPGPRLGSVVIEAKGVSKGFEERLLVDDMTFALPAGGIVGIIGPNGAGKTTLFRMITGQDAPDKGEIVIGDTVKLGYVDQTRDDLEPHKTVYEVISEGKEEVQLGERTVNARAYVGRFNFGGGDQQKKVSDLSGGERNRVHLAKILKEGANVLLLDEPTNDLDVNTLRALEEALVRFAGCAVVISHDRWFLDRIATHILAFEGDSKVNWFEGNWTEYDEDRHRRLGEEADQPHRIKYRQLTR